MVWELIASTVISLIGESQKAKASSAIADMQAEIADRRAVMAENLFKQAQKSWEHEKALVRDVMAVPPAVPVYAEAYATWDESVRTANLALEAAERDQLRACTALSLHDDVYMRRALAQIQVDLVGHTMRMAESRAHVLNDQRYSRQVAVIGLGRGKLLQSLRYGDLADVNRTVVRDAAMRTINSGFELWGYASTRITSGAAGYSARGTVAPRAVVNGVPQFSDGRYARTETAVQDSPIYGPPVPTLAGSPVDSNDGTSRDY